MVGDQAQSTENIPQFVNVPTVDGETADVNVDLITRMRPNPANKAQIILHFAGSYPAIGRDGASSSLAADARALEIRLWPNQSDFSGKPID
jgi:hypothetical protein